MAKKELFEQVPSAKLGDKVLRRHRESRRIFHVICRRAGHWTKKHVSGAVACVRHIAPAKPKLRSMDGCLRRPQASAILVGERCEAQAPLLQVYLAGHGPRLLPHLVQYGQHQRQQQGDDRDHHQQLDQCEGFSVPHFRNPSRWVLSPRVTPDLRLRSAPRSALV